MTSLDLTGGAVEVGILISVFLYGVATVQAYIYIRSSAQDPLWLRLLVIVVWLLETFITVFTCMYLYDLTITHFGDAGAFLEEPWTIAISFALGGIASALVQSFFAWRVYIISGRLETSVISWTGSLVRVGITMTICMLLLKTNSTVATFERDYPWSITFSLALAMFIDVLNTCSLCFWLWRKRDGHHRSVAIVDKILIWTIETGLVTSICEILMLTLDLTTSRYEIWVAILMFYAKLYSNSLLLSLNGRASLHTISGRLETTSTVLGTMSFARPTAATTTGAYEDTDGGIEMASMDRSKSGGPWC